MDFKEEVDKSLSYSIVEGSFYCTMLGFGESLFLTFAVFLNANSFMLALISTLPPLLGSLLQFFTNDLINFFGSRKRFVAIFAFLQGIMYIPIILTFLMPSWSVTSALIFITIYFSFGMIIAPAWVSWMGDLVPPNVRGAYFAKRNKIMGIAHLISMITAGLILQQFKHDSGYYYTGFVIIFLIAFLCRIVSSILLLLKYEPGFDRFPSSHFRFSHFVKQAIPQQYGFFVLYMVLLNFASFIAMPFFIPYMLLELQFDYLMLIIVNTVPVLVKFIILPRWGKACDHFGAHKVIILTGFFIPSIPILWLFSGNFYFLILVQAYCGFITAGFEIAVFNLILEVTTQRNRASFFAYYNISNGIAIFLGGICGGFLIEYLQSHQTLLLYSPYLLMFSLSGFLRILVSFLLRKIKPIVEYPDISYGKLLRLIISK